MHDQKFKQEHSIEIKRSKSGDIRSINLLVPGDNIIHHKIKIIDGELIIEPIKIFSNINDDQMLYDYFNLLIIRNKNNNIKEIHLQYPQSKLCHHTITIKNGEINIDPPVLPEPIDYVM
jgi:hypothetical protein